MTTLSVPPAAPCPLTVGPKGPRPAPGAQHPLKPRRFILLDRDGTLIVRWPDLSDPLGVELLPGVVPGLQRLQQAGFGLAVITNQSGIGRGRFGYDQLYAIHDRLSELLLRDGILLDGIYFCPHTPEDNCACRKPKPRLIHRAATELGSDPAQAFIIGDTPCNIELARRVNAAAVLIHPDQSGLARSGLPDHTAPSLLQAADWILAQTAERTAA